MLKIALRITKDFSRHIKQHQNKIPPYKFLLEHNPPSWANTQIKTNNIGLILERTHIFDNMRARTRNQGIILGAQNFYKLIKVYILLLNPEFFKARKFYNGTNEFLKHLCYNNFDFKYSELYEEEIIIRFVQIFQSSKYMNQEKQRITCDFLLLLLAENVHLQRALKKMTNAYYQKEQSLNELDLYKKNKNSKKEIFSIYTYPGALIKLIDKQQMYVTTYHNNYKRRMNQPYINRHDQTRHFRVKASMMEQLQRTYKDEQPYLENTKISRLDYFTALNYILKRQFYSEKVIQNFQFFCEEYDELYGNQDSSVGLVEFLQSMMLCKLFQNLLVNSQIISQQFHKKIKSQYYRKYSQKYVTYLQKIEFKSLYQLVIHTSNLFPKHAPINLHDSIEPSRIMDAYKFMCQQVLDYYNNGQLVTQNFNLNTIIELIYSNFDKNDAEWVVRILQKYEKQVYLWTIYSKKTEKRSKSTIIYLLMLKYGLKSDLIGENLYSSLEKEAWITQQISIIEKRDPSQTSLFSTFSSLFQYYLYLQIIETPSKQSELIERLFLSKMVNLKLFSKELQDIEQKDEIQKQAIKHKFHARNIYWQTGLSMNTSSKLIHQDNKIDDFVENQSKLVNVYKMLMLIDKAFQLIAGSKQQAQMLDIAILEDIFQQTLNIFKTKFKLQKLISYPQILKYICKISTLVRNVQIKFQIYSQITEIILYIKNKKNFKVQASRIFIFNEYLLLDYRSMYNNLQSARMISLKKYLNQEQYDQELEYYAHILKEQVHASGIFNQKQSDNQKSNKSQNMEQFGKKLQEYFQKQGGTDKLAQLKDEEPIKQIEYLIKTHLFQEENVEKKDQNLEQLAKEIYVLVKQKVLETERSKKRQSSSLINKEAVIPDNVGEKVQQDNIIEDILQKIDIHKRKTTVKSILSKTKKELLKKPLFSFKAKLIDKADTVQKLFKNTRHIENEASVKVKEAKKTKIQNGPQKADQSVPVAQTEDPLKIIKMLKQRLGKARTKQGSRHLFSKKK